MTFCYRIISYIFLNIDVDINSGLLDTDLQPLVDTLLYHC